MTGTNNQTRSISANVNAVTIWQPKTIFRVHKFANCNIINWNDVKNHAKAITCWQRVETEHSVFSCGELVETTTDPSLSSW